MAENKQKDIRGNIYFVAIITVLSGLIIVNDITRIINNTATTSTYIFLAIFILIFIINYARLRELYKARKAK